VKKTGIYQIRNKTNGKRYIGSASSIGGFLVRWNKHKNELRKAIHHSSKLQRAWNKYGADAFVFEILLYCDPENCLMYEQIAMDHYKPEYNVSQVAGSPMFGVNHSKRFKDKRRKAWLGKKNPNYGKRGEKSHFYGIKRSESTKRLMSIATRGEKNTSAKLTANDVRRIRKLLTLGYSCIALARKYLVKDATISEIKLRQRWKHI